MYEGLVTAAYIIAAILFIFSLSGLSKQKTSQKGNYFGIIGMSIALTATILKLSVNNILWILIAITIGGLIGIRLARRIEVIKIPELVAILHSFVGLAAVLVGFSNYLHYNKNVKVILINIHLIEVFFSIFIGAITFTGSIVAFGKLCGKLSSKPLALPNRNIINLLFLSIFSLLLIIFIQTSNIELQILILLLITIIALIFGWCLVISIGGADMPVIISMLNSYSGWSAASTGFIISNDLLIITGSLVGSSGAILSYIMCKAMHRSFIKVITGGSSVNSSSSTGNDKKVDNNRYLKISIEEVAKMLKSSRSIIIVPGYGMAVSRAHYSIAEITNKLRPLGIKVHFGIHPVAGRLPGHMNVLLAEANIPYNIVLDMDEINNDFDKTDTVLVIGANDIVNPITQNDTKSQISGMPVLEVWKAKNVIVFKRSMNTGYSGEYNPLFFRENTYMLFGDAKTSIDAILRLI